MAESTYPTIGHEQVNVFVFPLTNTETGAGSWSNATGNFPTLFQNAQIDRCQSIGLGAFDLSFRKRYETGKKTYIELVPSTSVDKPATIEWLEHGSLHHWNLLTGKKWGNTAALDQDDFDATSSECAIVMHKTDSSDNIIESDIIWRCVVDTVGISVPNSQDDDLRCSVRLTGDEWVMAGNTAGAVIVDCLVVASSQAELNDTMYSDVANVEDTEQDFSTTGGAAINEWFARKFTPDYSGDVKSVTVQLDTTGAGGGGNVQACIYTDDGGGTSLPSAQTGGNSGSIVIDDIPNAQTSITFSWGVDSLPALTASTAYWVVLKTTDYTYTDGVTDLMWHTDANGAVALNECATYDSNASPVWATLGADVGTDVVVTYNCPIERDDWPDDADDSTTRTLFSATEAAAEETLTVVAAGGTQFGDGELVLLYKNGGDWETAKIDSSAANDITVIDPITLTTGYVAGSDIRRTRGFMLFVYNATDNAYLEEGTDYQVYTEDGHTQLINVSGGTALTNSDIVWVGYCVGGRPEYWTNNTTDLFGIVPTEVKFVVAPDEDFDQNTACVSTTVVDDQDNDFQSSDSGVAGEWWAVRFSAGINGDLSTAAFSMDTTGFPIGQVWAELYTNDAVPAPDEPDIPSGNPSELIDISTISTTESTVTFTWTDGPSLTSGTLYWIVIKTAGYIYVAGEKELILRTLDGGGEVVFDGDGAVSTTWADGADTVSITVTCVGSQEIMRLQGLDLSVTFSRTAYYETGNTSTIEREFEETDSRLTLPMYDSDITSLTRVAGREPSSIKTLRPEQAPEIAARLEIYENDQRLAGGIKLNYEFPGVKRSGFERTGTANERSTKRITLIGDEFGIDVNL